MSLLPFGCKVVGVGLGRTGTVSLAAALNHLGIRTKHFPGPLTRQDLRSGRKHIEILGEYQGIANGTGSPYPLIDREYPGSKFILTIRSDTHCWLRSKRRYADLEVENWSRFHPGHRASKRLIRETVYGSLEFDADRWLGSYESHNREVRNYFAGRPGQLLEMDISAGDGWDALCPFLGVPTPVIAFPHANSFQSVTTWYSKLDQVWADLEQCLAHEQPFVLVDDGDVEILDRGALPFFQRHGQYWGPPPDDRSAIAELERMRVEMGAAFLAFIWSTFWWLDHYEGFHEHLAERYRCVLKNDRVIVFDLRAHQAAGNNRVARPT